MARGRAVGKSKAAFERAAAHLAEADPALGRLIARVGPYGLTIDPLRSPFEALVRAVAHQQLSPKAAETILGRFIAIYGDGAFPAPDAVLATAPERLRAVGFSGAKTASIRDIAEKTIDGTVPPLAALDGMTDEDIVQRLVTIRGVGRWTVEMLLMFRLGRPDVLPVGDYGVRRGFQIAFRKREIPTPREVAARGERWRPHRTMASWYLWRALD